MNLDEVRQRAEEILGSLFMPDAEGDVERLARDVLALCAEVERLRAALLTIEWCWDGDADRCPSCGMTERQGHDRSCSTGHALAAPPRR